MPYLINEGKAKVLRGKRRVFNEGIDATVHQRYRILNAPTDRREAVDLIREYFSYGCQCEHDCCGHWFGSPNQIRKVRKGTYTFNVTSLRNL